MDHLEARLIGGRAGVGRTTADARAPAGTLRVVTDGRSVIDVADGVTAGRVPVRIS
jgi:hypothetical protein